MPVVALDLSAIANGLANDANAVRTALTALQTAINALDDTNIAPAAAIAPTKLAPVTDARLASPNNAIWRTLAEAPFGIGQGITAGTYWFDIGFGNPIASGSGGAPFPVNLDPAEYVVAGKTAKLRLRVTLLVGGAPAIAPVFGIYRIAALGGTTSVVATLGAVVAGSTATFAGLVTPGAGVTAVSGAFDFPLSGQYLFGVNVPGTTAANSVMYGRMQLSISHV